MPKNDAKSNIALRIEEAKQDFEARLDEAFHRHLDELGNPLEIDLNGDNEVVREEHGELLQEVKMLVEAFGHQAPIQEADVHVHKITVVDSNKDGRLAINVMYDHRAY